MSTFKNDAGIGLVIQPTHLPAGINSSLKVAGGETRHIPNPIPNPNIDR
jgi:hypothetical protein